MKMRKALAAFLAMICIVNCFGICTFGVSAEGTTAVYAETSATLKQGETGYAYINIENMQALATITVTVHFDPAKIRVTDAYNQVDCVMHDDVIGENYVQFTYLFNGEGSQDRTTLFFFYYDVLETAAVGTTYFDITISDACDIDLNELPIAGSRCSFRISERAEEKYCYIYADDYIYTSVQQEFTISYRVDSWDIASGVFAIHYDPELFECVGWSSGEMLENKLTDVNTALAGSVYVSFVGTEYSYTGNLGSVTFRTKKNVTQNADIQLTVTNFYDFDLNSIISNGHTANVEMQYDESYIEDAPKMSASAKFDAQTQQVTVQIHLDANSHLGAGDFVLKFDENVLNYYSLKKEFQPTFFLTNTQKVDQGELKFSIISTTDIITQEVVLTVIFDVIPQCQELNLTFELSGSNLANAMTESIMLNFVDTNLTIPMKQHSYTSVVTKPTCTEKGYTTHTCACGHSYVDSYVDATGHKDSNKDHSCDNGCGVYQGTHADGNDEDHLCDYGCGATLSDHSYSSEVTKPTCTDRGYTTHTCDCGHSYVDSYVDATGHKDSNKDHTCDTCGKENITDHDYVNGSCSYCGATDPTICIKGDLDLDGDVDAQDLTMLARHVAGIEQVASQALGNADVNNDGDIDANDLTMHARYIAGIITDWEQE